MSDSLRLRIACGAMLLMVALAAAPAHAAARQFT
jgi:hypothetical protein